MITGQAGTSFVSVSSLVLRGIRLVPTTCFSPQSRCGGSFDLFVVKRILRAKDNAPINDMPAGGGEAGHGVGISLFSKIWNQIPCPWANHSRQMQTKFPHPRLHIAVNPKAEPKKGTIKISPNKTLQSFINVAASPKIHVPVTAAFIRFNHNPCYTV